MSENTLIKAFVIKCISAIKYRYYARFLGERGFKSDRKGIEDLAENETYHAFALLDKLGYDESENLFQDLIENEKKQIEIEKQQNTDELFSALSKIDEKHLSVLNKLKEDNEKETKMKKCTLCGFNEKSCKENFLCPRCRNTEFTSL